MGYPFGFVRSAAAFKGGVLDFSETEQYLARQIHLRSNTYYVGGIAKFELAERVAAHARGIMDGAFDGIRKKERLTVLKNLWFYYLKSRSPVK